MTVMPRPASFRLRATEDVSWSQIPLLRTVQSSILLTFFGDHGRCAVVAAATPVQTSNRRLRSMTTSEADFFTTIAAAIPVLLVAYTFQFAQFATHKLGPGYDRSMRMYLLSITNFATRRAVAISRGTGALLITLGVAASLIILVLSVVLPAIGEYEAVSALATHSASSTAKAWALRGLWAALIAVTVPLLVVVVRAFSFFPFVAYWKTVRKNAKDIEGIYHDWSICEDWFDTATSFMVVNGAASPPWIGGANFDTFKAAAWGGAIPEHRGTVMLDDTRVIVFDRVAGQKRATFFETEHTTHKKLKQLVAYGSRDQALDEHDPPRPLRTLLTLLAYRQNPEVTAPGQDGG